MAQSGKAHLATPFQGRWRIVEMELWGRDAIDLLGPASLAIDGERGEMRFIAVNAWLDVRYATRDGAPLAEFSWEGSDEGDSVSGRGWLSADRGGRLEGRILFHNGDESGFVCEPA